MLTVLGLGTGVMMARMKARAHPSKSKPARAELKGSEPETHLVLVHRPLVQKRQPLQPSQQHLPIRPPNFGDALRTRISL